MPCMQVSAVGFVAGWYWWLPSSSSNVKSTFQHHEWWSIGIKLLVGYQLVFPSSVAYLPGAFSNSVLPLSYRRQQMPLKINNLQHLKNKGSTRTLQLVIQQDARHSLHENLFGDINCLVWIFTIIWWLQLNYVHIYIFYISIWLFKRPSMLVIPHYLTIMLLYPTFLSFPHLIPLFLFLLYLFISLYFIYSSLVELPFLWYWTTYLILMGI